MLRAFIDGMCLRCPQCHRGRMFDSWFHMRSHCPVCNLPFEQASGEITGGMGISIVVTLFLAIAGAVWIGFSDMPVLPALVIGGLIIVLFPIVFYPFSRALWTSFLYVTGDNSEPD